MDSDEWITLTGEDGAEHMCRLLSVFEFEERQYALLLDSGPPGGAAEEPDTVLMRVLEKDDQAVFEPVDDDEEFSRVEAYVKEAIEQLEDDDDEADD
jgi:uncharacterized protein YrzB (UPF0473 family)